MLATSIVHRMSIHAGLPLKHEMLEVAFTLLSAMHVLLPGQSVEIDVSFGFKA